MAIQVASTPAAPLSAKTAQVTGQKKNGKNWHENKAPFRPSSGLTSYAKRAEKQKQEAEVKKMEKEMKEEKEQERQVRAIVIWTCGVAMFLTLFAEESPGYQGQACREGGEGALRVARGQDARKACGPSEAQREEEQDAQVLERGFEVPLFFFCTFFV
jgi:hypothetical protein